MINKYKGRELSMENKVTMDIKEVKKLSRLLERAYNFTNGGPSPQLTEDLLKAKYNLDKKSDEVIEVNKKTKKYEYKTVQLFFSRLEDEERANILNEFGKEGWILSSLSENWLAYFYKEIE